MLKKNYVKLLALLAVSVGAGLSASATVYTASEVIMNTGQGSGTTIRCSLLGENKSGNQIWGSIKGTDDYAYTYWKIDGNKVGNNTTSYSKSKSYELKEWSEWWIGILRQVGKSATDCYFAKINGEKSLNFFYCSPSDTPSCASDYYVVASITANLSAATYSGTQYEQPIVYSVNGIQSAMFKSIQVDASYDNGQTWTENVASSSTQAGTIIVRTPWDKTDVMYRIKAYPNDSFRPVVQNGYWMSANTANTKLVPSGVACTISTPTEEQMKDSFDFSKKTFNPSLLWNTSDYMRKAFSGAKIYYSVDNGTNWIQVKETTSYSSQDTVAVPAGYAKYRFKISETPISELEHIQAFYPESMSDAVVMTYSPELYNLGVEGNFDDKVDTANQSFMPTVKYTMNADMGALADAKAKIYYCTDSDTEWKEIEGGITFTGIEGTAQVAVPLGAKEYKLKITINATVDGETASYSAETPAYSVTYSETKVTDFTISDDNVDSKSYIVPVYKAKVNWFLSDPRYVKSVKLERYIQLPLGKSTLASDQLAASSKKDNTEYGSAVGSWVDVLEGKTQDGEDKASAIAFSENNTFEDTFSSRTLIKESYFNLSYRLTIEYINGMFDAKEVEMDFDNTKNIETYDANGISKYETEVYEPAQVDIEGRYTITNAGNYINSVQKLNAGEMVSDAVLNFISDVAVPDTISVPTITNEAFSGNIKGNRFSLNGVNRDNKQSLLGTLNVDGLIIKGYMNFDQFSSAYTATKEDNGFSYNFDDYKFNQGEDLVLPSEQTSVYVKDFTYLDNRTTSDQYLTVCLPFDLDKDMQPEDGTVYAFKKAAVEDDVCTVTFEKTEGTLNAGTPAVVKFPASSKGTAWVVETSDSETYQKIATAPVSATQTVSLSAEEGASTATGLYGVFNETIGLTNAYTVDGEGSALNATAEAKAFSSYLYLNETASTYVLKFDDDPSGIDGIDADTAEAGPVDIYDLGGNLVAKQLTVKEAKNVLGNGTYVAGRQVIIIRK